MLSSHGGEIFLHVLNSNRSTLEDPPSISEGCGGRVTDYRITVVPLANLIVKEVLTEEDVLTCQKTIYNLVDMERKNDPLPISTVGSRGKGPKRLKGLLEKDDQESEVIKDSPDSPEPLNKKPRLIPEEVQPPERAKGFSPHCPATLLSMWTNRITVANSRKHQEFFGRASSVNSKFELYQQLKEENG
ncbi:hypothetical protein GOODEAATRI_028175 [Goodea atripinnis]|uniref:Uncharacterized protein n=1 Tax=Goodea atripinnis TaxID=208336 RepID=A0ABV0P162_9TELE